MLEYQVTPRIIFTELLLRNHPDAAAHIKGSSENPMIDGMVKFYQTAYGGLLIEAQIFGLPDGNRPDASNFYAMHIHESGDCSGDFSQTGMHYNPANTEHPDHAGDMPPLLSDFGYAFSVFYDRRLTIQEIMGRSVIIHEKADDFTTQPAGNAGARIACGEIKWVV